MNEKTLVIMAAGLGRRYGGLKQIAPLGPNGEILMDYALYDAALAGFTRAVFIAAPDMAGDFLARFAHAPSARGFELDVAVQRMDDLPAGLKVPEGRTRPWGTGHAAWAARGRVHTPFGLIGADDFFGRETLAVLSRALDAVTPENLAMVGFALGNTLSPEGRVSRGVCAVRDGLLTSVTERTDVFRTEHGVVYARGDAFYPLPEDAIVSMNVWGIHPAVFEYMTADFAAFLAGMPEPLTWEYYLPAAIDRYIAQGRGQVAVYDTPARWHGVTYAADRLSMAAALADLHAAGVYPPLG
jgi:hypothetical protein